MYVSVTIMYLSIILLNPFTFFTQSSNSLPCQPSVYLTKFLNSNSDFHTSPCILHVFSTSLIQKEKKKKDK